MEEYYIPEKEDLRLGYEYQEFLPSWNVWEDRKIEELHNTREGSGGFADIEYLLDDRPQHIRVLHLTKEQIEKEGWKLKDSPEYSDIKDDLDGDTDTSGWYMFRKGKWEVRWWGKPDYIEIYETYLVGVFLPTDEHKKLQHSCIYKGTCLSINEFRQITKLLQIK
jgi:hypothetical protein